MKDTKKLISILLPVYNIQAYLNSCLESLTSQTYKEIEIIVIDDLSKDTTHLLLRKWRKKDKRIRIFKNIKRYGLSVCLNRALRKAKGDYVAFMDANDVSAPNRLQKQITFLLNNPKIAALGTQCVFVNEKGKQKAKSDFPQSHDIIYHTLLKNPSLKFESLLINKSILPKDILKFPSEFCAFLTKDKYKIYTDLLLKMLPYGQFANLSDYLYRSKITSSSPFSPLTTLKLWIKSIVMHEYHPSLRLFYNANFPQNIT